MAITSPDNPPAGGGPRPAQSWPVPRPSDIVARIAGELRGRERFLLTSHVRPDGDSIGSQLALAYALERLGKRVRIVNHDAAGPGLQAFPGVTSIEIAERAEGEYDAAIVL